MKDCWKLPRRDRSEIGQKIKHLQRKINDCDRAIDNLEPQLKRFKDNKIKAEKDLDNLCKEYNITI